MGRGRRRCSANVYSNLVSLRSQFEEYHGGILSTCLHRDLLVATDYQRRSRWFARGLLRGCGAVDRRSIGRRGRATVAIAVGSRVALRALLLARHYLHVERRSTIAMGRYVDRGRP